MKQFEKLQDLVRNPKKYGVKRGTRVSRMLYEIYMYGKVRTGYSAKGVKYIDTAGVFNALQAAGVACTHYNDAPRGGASGEHVALIGKVARDAVAAFNKFVEGRKKQNPKKRLYTCDLEEPYLAQLEK